MYKINILEDSGIIEVVGIGELSSAELDQERQDVAAISKETGYIRILVDDSAIASMPSIAAIYQFGASFFQSGLPSNIKVARVISREILSDSEFLENVAVNRGTNVKTFQDREKAWAWLVQ